MLREAAEAARAPETAVTNLNEGRPLATRGMRTAVAVDSESPRWYPAVDRRASYEAASRAIRNAVQERKSDRQRRQAEREAILQTLEEFALIERTRGGVPSPRKERKSVPG